MCKIIINQPGFTLPFDMLQNAVYNNPHGFGLVLKDKENKKLQIIRKCNPGKDNDPKEIHDLMKKHEDVERILHVRWRTEGPINIENTHPFDTYHTEERTVCFMHNGTLQDYKPVSHYTYLNGIRQEIPSPDSNISDSKKFNDEFLIPFLALTKGDITDPMVSTIIHKFWGLAAFNRKILISSDQDNFLINKDKWETIKTEGGEFLASNNTYFKDLTRGPEFERRKKEKEEKEKLERASREPRFPAAREYHGHNSYENDWPVVPIRDIELKKHGQLPNNINKLIYDVDVWNDEGLAQLANLTAIELEDFVKKNPDDCVTLMVHMTHQFKEIFNKYERTAAYLESIHAKNKKVG